MNKLKTLFLALLSILIILPAALSAQPNVSWSMALVKNNLSIPFSKPVDMEDGDRFSIIITTNQACYVYLIVQDSEEEMFVLLNQRFIAGQRYETDIFRIVPPSGSENFYIIASQTEQKNLDNSIKALMNQSNTRTKRDLLNAVRTLRRSASAFKEEPEKPVQMGGTFRGAAASELINGIEYGGAPVYVKNIIINH